MSSKKEIKQVHLELSYDLNGTYRDSTLTGDIGSLQELGIAIEGNRITDHLVQGWIQGYENYSDYGYSPDNGTSAVTSTKYEVFKDHVCFEFLNKPETVNFVTELDESSLSEVTQMDDLGFKITTGMRSYSRVRTITINEVQGGSSEEEYSMIASFGYWRSKNKLEGNIIEEEPNKNCSNCNFFEYDPYGTLIISISINQKDYSSTPSETGIQYQYYADNDQRFSSQTSSHVLPSISVDSTGTVYSANKIFLSGGIVTEGGEFVSMRPLAAISGGSSFVAFTLDTANSCVTFQYSQNTSKLKRAATFQLKCFNYQQQAIQDVCTLTIIQNAEQEDTTSQLYFNSTQCNLGSIGTSINLPYTYKGSATRLKVEIPQENWISIDSTASYNGGSISSSIGYIQVDYQTNSSEYLRSSSITLTEEGIQNPKVATVNIMQLGNENSQSGIIEDEVGTGIFTAIDDNVGRDYNSDSLLYKQNSSNIYSTLASKDNTLFLGNYVNENFSLKLYNEYPSLYSGKKEIKDGIDLIDLHEDSGSIYNYVPNMLLNSQDKRIFKKSEKYSLGMVCVHKTGTVSSVIHLGTYYPADEPSYFKNTNTSKWVIQKPKAIIDFDQDQVARLKSLGVQALIPVYAYRNHHKIICQGFLNVTASNTKRQEQEKITSQYNWFQRDYFNDTSIQGENEFSHNQDAEFQYRVGATVTDKDGNKTEAEDSWSTNNSILTLNTPEMEFNSVYSPTNAELVNSNLNILGYYPVNAVSYIHHVQLQVNGSYLYSNQVPIEGGYTSSSIKYPRAIWKGFLNIGDYGETNKEQNTESSTQFIEATNQIDNYKTFYVYPWQRDIIGGEGPDSKMNKKYFECWFMQNFIPFSGTGDSRLNNIDKAITFSQKHNTTLLKYDDKIYQGVVDYLITPKIGYKAFTLETQEGTSNNLYPVATEKSKVYAGYDTEGNIKDPIMMRYNPSPHIVLFMGEYASGDRFKFQNNSITVAELQANVHHFDEEETTLESLPWFKCGDIVPLNSQTARLEYKEGDYFYGRFDSLRVYPYSQEDTNSVTEIVSGMLCSRVNLDARHDSNRGVTTPIVTTQNFNLYNEVYSQINSYFTYSYINLSDPSYKRTFKNSVQWSMGKTFGNDIDDWCNIQDINTLDLDGDKGPLTALVRFDNNIFSFQETGIAQIMYNDQMQLSTTAGVPIEIANSGRVNGKRYLYENIGCQNQKAITQSLNGVYFIDSINKSIYRLGPKGEITDICTSGGMKSWGLARLNKQWQLWYDLYAQEIIAVSDNECLSYHDIKERFQCFLSYEGIYNEFSLNGRVFMFKEALYSNTLWKKNDAEGVNFFGKDYPIGIELQINPNPTTDKTFTNLEYRADVIDSKGVYQPLSTFDQLDAWNEYQYGHYDLKDDKDKPSNLKKKFRIWRANIPRAIEGINPIFLNGEEGWIQDITPNRFQIDMQDIPEMKQTRDRMRNPWLRIRLVKNINPHKMIAHDFVIQYVE